MLIINGIDRKNEDISVIEVNKLKTFHFVSND